MEAAYGVRSTIVQGAGRHASAYEARRGQMEVGQVEFDGDFGEEVTTEQGKTGTSFLSAPCFELSMVFSPSFLQASAQKTTTERHDMTCVS